MATTPTIDLVAEKRVPFTVSIPEMGIDYTGATFLAEVRTQKGGGGDPLISLATAAPSAEGVSVSYDANYADPLGELPNGASLVRLNIGETTMEGLPYSADPSQTLLLYYDIHLVPTVGDKLVFCGGRLFVEPGVTR